MNKIPDKSKILKLLLDNLQTDIEFESCLNKTLDELKISSKTKQKISKEIFNDGIDSFISELNNFINEMMNKGKPRNFNKLRINEKIRLSLSSSFKSKQYFLKKDYTICKGDFFFL